MGVPGRGSLGMEMKRVCGTVPRVWKTFLIGHRVQLTLVCHVDSDCSDETLNVCSDTI